MGNRAPIITGATRGIGNGLFKTLALQNVNVATLYHPDERAAENFIRDAEKFGIGYNIERLNICEYERLIPL